MENCIKNVEYTFVARGFVSEEIDVKSECALAAKLVPCRAHVFQSIFLKKEAS